MIQIQYQRPDGTRGVLVFSPFHAGVRVVKIASHLLRRGYNPLIVISN